MFCLIVFLQRTGHHWKILNTYNIYKIMFYDISSQNQKK